MSTIPQITSAEQLFQAPGLGPCELVQGTLVMMSPGGFEHGSVVASITGPLAVYVRERRLGQVTGAETGFQIAHHPDTVRAPDVAFVRAQRIPEVLPRGFFQGAPDLAVEVISPHDRASEVLAKVRGWLDAGSLAVWVVDPPSRTVTVYASGLAAILLGQEDHVDGGEILPGFRLSVAEIFAR